MEIKKQTKKMIITELIILLLISLVFKDFISSIKFVFVFMFLYFFPILPWIINLKIGDITFVIADVILVEPDQPLSLFEFGPRILIPESNLEEINLIGDKSRVFYETLIKTSGDIQSREIITYLNQYSEEREGAEFYFDENNSLKRFVLNFLFFVKLISLFRKQFFSYR